VEQGQDQLPRAARRADGDPTQTIEVPANQGFAFVNSRTVLIGLMQYSWFSSRLQNAINTLGIPPTVIPIILNHNTMLYIGNPNNCCIIGYHGARSSLNGNGAQAVQTYMFGSFITPQTFSGFDQPRRGLGDIHALSHEVSEWYDDPFVNNYVQPGANGVWHPEDEVHFSFFARQVPSIAYAGRYTYMGTFDHPAHDCS
jgi:hypothetical protein